MDIFSWTSPLMQGRGLKYSFFSLSLLYLVAPYAGAWIEISLLFSLLISFMSPLMQGRGLKLLTEPGHRGEGVAPYAGAWIEIGSRSYWCRWYTVAPYAGAWIEINLDHILFLSIFIYFNIRSSKEIKNIIHTILNNVFLLYHIITIK